MGISALAAGAADITGKWVATTPGFDGNSSEMVFRFKQSGETLTGTIDSMRGDEKIAEGKVSGSTIQFMTVERLLPGVEVKTIYKGTIGDNEIKLARTVDDGTGGSAGGDGRGGRGPGAGGRAGRRGGPFGSGELLLKKAN
jgi:hypothetical protein